MKTIPVYILLLSLSLSSCGLFPSSQSLTEAAGKAAAKGDYATAVEKYKEAEALAPIGPEALRLEIAALEQIGGSDDELIAAYEALYATGSFEEGDYLTLTDMYLNAGRNASARDILEISQCIAPTEEKRALLETITVDISQDSTEINGLLTPLFEALSKGDMDGAVKALLAVDGTEVEIASRVKGISRRYISGDGSFVLTVSEDGLLADGTAAGTSYELSLSEDVLLAATVGDGGDFTVWAFRASNGSTCYDSGVINDGIVTGTVTTKLAGGEEAAELAALWSGRDTAEYTEYTGELDETGHCLADKPSGIEDGRICYAYDSGKDNYVYITVTDTDTAADYVFTPATFGMAG